MMFAKFTLVKLQSSAVCWHFSDVSISEEESARKSQPELNLKLIALKTGARWPQLAKELGLSPEDIEMVAQESLLQNLTQSESDRKRCEHMLALWTQRCAAGVSPSENLGELSTSSLITAP